MREQVSPAKYKAMKDSARRVYSDWDLQSLRQGDVYAYRNDLYRFDGSASSRIEPHSNSTGLFASARYPATQLEQDGWQSGSDDDEGVASDDEDDASGGSDEEPEEVEDEPEDDFYAPEHDVMDCGDFPEGKGSGGSDSCDL